MSNSESMPRRNFVRNLSLAASAVATGSLLDASPAAAVAPPSDWDMSWVARVTGTHRLTFDIGSASPGMSVAPASTWMEGVAAAHGVPDSDMNAVLVYRHDAVTAVLNDAMRKRLGITAQPEHAPEGMPTLAGIMARGAIILACNRALGGQAYALRQKETGLSETESHAQIRAAVISGVYVMPNGIFALGRAQTAGCGYFKPG